MTIIHFDIVALVIVMILFISVILRKQYLDRSNLIMFILIITAMISTVGDLGGAVIGNYMAKTELNRMMMFWFNQIYFISHVMLMPIYLLYVYSSVDVWHLFINSRKLRMAWAIPVLTMEMLFLMNGWFLKIFYITEDLVYVRGNLLVLAYVLAAFYGIWSLWGIVRYRKVINRDKMVTLLFLIGIVGAGVLLQLFVGEILIEMFAISISILFYSVVVRREETQFDPITGALRRGEGIERISKNFISMKPSTVLAVRLNNYRNINLYLGEAAYHRFLRDITDNLRRICKENTFPSEIYYFENGLFVVLGDKNIKDKAKDIAEQVNNLYADAYKMDDFVLFPEIKQCIISQPDDVSDVNAINSLIMSFHKSMAVDEKICIYSDYIDDREFKLRNDVDKIIRRALEHRGFEMYYQPIYSTVDKCFVAAEALIRLNDKEYGFVSPRYFIQAAENSGDIHAIGDFVLNEVVRFISEADIEKYGLKYIEINLSASQCIESDLVEKIMGTLEKYNVKPEQLSLEITETAANINPAIVDMNIQKLHNEGIRFALDDYGTGYSNIKRVVALPVDQVKLDKSFVDMIDDPNMWIVIQDTIQMLKEMRKEVLVEGIEDADVAKRFTELRPDLIQGCELIQGFYFCKPLPKQEFIEFMKATLAGRK